MKILLFIAGLLICTHSYSQSSKGVLTFENKKIDLGNIIAEDEPYTVTFKVKNSGDAPVLITQVRPYASQMQAIWDKAPIVPGGTAEINIQYISSTLSPNAVHNIGIISNAQNRNEVISFTAKVIDNPKKPYLLYKQEMDSVRFKQTSISFGSIFTDQVVTDTFFFYNTRSEILTLGTRYVPKHITVSFIPETVKPGEKGMIIVNYNAKAKNDFGYVYDNIILNFNGSNNYHNRITINANLNEDFSRLSKNELQNAPIAKFKETVIDFGNIKEGDKADCDFILENTGKSNLIIRKTKAGCGCTAVTMGKNTIEPGETTTIRASFSSKGRRGSQHKSITVITNDPQHPETNLSIKGIVE